MAALWVRGHNIDLSAFAGEQPRRVSLPTYAFDKIRYWVDSPEEQRSAVTPVADAGSVIPSEPSVRRQPRPAFFGALRGSREQNAARLSGDL